MSSSEIDLADEIEQAWTGFRGRLADRLAGLEDDDILLVEMETGNDEGDLAGCAPYLQFVAWGGDLVRAEVSSNSYLDERYELTDQDEELLVERGWLAPTCGPEDEADSGSANFHTDLERNHADLAATMAVQALRDAFGCAHPIFLDADGLEIDPDFSPPVIAPGSTGDAVEDEDDDEPLVEFPGNPLELREMVDRAVAQMFDEPLYHDDDGDIAILTGSTPLWVRVIADAPAVDVFSHVVTDFEDAERADQEVAMLNRSHPFAKFYVRDDVIVMRYRQFAIPFVPQQLRSVLAQLLGDIDDLARDLAARVGGRRFFEPEPEAEAEDEVDSDEDSQDRYRFVATANPPALVGLLELLYDGPAGPASVAVLFDNDRHAIINELVRLRTGIADPGDHDLDLVLDQLRAALRFVADVDAAPAPPKRLPPKPRTRQLSLIPEAQASLDLDEPS